MKYLFFVLIIGLSVIFFSYPKQALAGTVDQSCDASGSEEKIHMGTTPAAQTFKPTLDRLTSVTIDLETDAIGSFYFQVIRDVGSELVYRTTIAETAVGRKSYYIPIPDAVMHPGEVYTLGVWATAPGNAVLEWFDKPDCYDGGKLAPPGGTYEPALDFGFATSGYDSTAAPTPAPSSSPSSTLSGSSSSAAVSHSTSTTTRSPALNQPGVTAGSGSAPSAKTSASIKPPTDLKATQGSNFVSLSWTKSTSNVDGYRIFRKATGGDYQEITVAEKTVSTVDDINVTAGTEYTYMVRAYKESDQSANSNEVMIKIQSAEANSATQNPWWHKYQWLLIGAGILIILLAGGWWFFKNHKLSLTTKK